LISSHFSGVVRTGASVPSLQLIVPDEVSASACEAVAGVCAEAVILANGMSNLTGGASEN
jgi:hypothetical protein